MPHTRLLPPETLEKVGSLLAQTLHDKFDPLDSQDWAARATLTDSEVFDLLGFKISDLPRPYKQWRFSTEVYALIEGTIFLLLNDQFVRHRRLSQEELTMVLSPRTAPFQDNLERNSGIMLAVVAVPGRLGSLSGLRGERRSLVDAGQAIGRIQKLWSDSGFQNQWSWELEFYDDTCTRALGIDGLERLPIALAYKIES